MADPVAALILLLAATGPGSRDEDLDARERARRIKNGDRAAFRQFFDRHHGRLLGYVRSKGVPPEEAEDIVQNAFLYIWNHRDRIDPNQSLRAYLFRIGYTRALNHRRDTAKFDDATEPQDAASSDRRTPETEAMAADVRRQIDAAIAELPDRRRAVFELCVLQDLTYREAADALDITRKTVENHMRLALRDLREALDDPR
jgi:RNA polymerase sigma-70 factor (ECF subfamily)